MSKVFRENQRAKVKIVKKRVSLSNKKVHSINLIKRRLSIKFTLMRIYKKDLLIKELIYQFCTRLEVKLSIDSPNYIYQDRNLKEIG